MARIPILKEDDPTLTAEQKACLAEAKHARGTLLNIHRAMANRPEAARTFQQMIRVVYRNDSTLTPKHGELAYLTATAVNNCYY